MNDPKVAKCLHDPKWKFYKDTNVKRMFDRIRRQMKDSQQESSKEHVVPMRRKA